MGSERRALRRCALLLVTAIAGCGHSDTVATAVTPVRFLVVGDFGTGGPQQYLVASAMQQVCAARGCDFVIATGDNIYDQPVSATDPQFESKFELPYQNLDAPWYLALGNHDVGANPLGGDFGDNEIAYGQRTDRISDKWNMPSRYYRLQKGAVEFFVLDTNRMQPDASSTSSESGWADQQRPWLVAALASSSAPWKFVVGHHPYRTSGGHALDLIDSYREKLRGTVCGVADAFLTGHDHILEWLQPASDCPGTELLISGAGGQTPDLAAGAEPQPTYYYAFNTYGFLYVTLSENAWTGEFYNEQAQLLFSRTVTRSGAH
jgi:tartrate-resistant acid phosphatase type 5